MMRNTNEFCYSLDECSRIIEECRDSRGILRLQVMMWVSKDEYTDNIQFMGVTPNGDIYDLTNIIVILLGTIGAKYKVKIQPRRREQLKSTWVVGYRMTLQTKSSVTELLQNVKKAIRSVVPSMTDSDIVTIEF